MRFAADKAAVAELANTTLESYTEGDCVAAAIVEKAADRLSLGVERVADQLDLPDRFSVALAGGLLNHHPSYFHLLKRKIHSLLPGAETIHPKMTPVQGAVLSAFVHVGVSIDDTVVTNLRKIQES